MPVKPLTRFIDSAQHDVDGAKPGDADDVLLALPSM